MTLSMADTACYTLIASRSDGDVPSDIQLKTALEKGDDKSKAETLKRLITMILNGEKVDRSMLMYVIRFCLPSQDHLIKKLLLIFWEVVPKTSSDGKLLQEMILVCDAYRKDLQHPNEFLRGSTLRFLCKLKEPELLEPLMPAIRACLEHRHSYVRRNAVLAIYTIYRNFEFLIPDAPELVYNFLEAEQDASAKRNAFMMLLHVDQARALDYLSGCIDQVTSFSEILQLVIVELIYKVCYANKSERARFIRCVYNLLQSSSGAVRYEAAGTLLTLSAAPTAIKAAAQAYIDLVVKESDNNIKLIVLDRLAAMRATNAGERVLQEMVMDILRVLVAPDIEVRRKTLALALDLISSRNVEEMCMFLRKEIARTANAAEDDTGKYRQLLVRTLHSATIRFPDVAQNIIPVLMEFLSDTTELAAQDVLVFVREAVHKLPHLRGVILQQLSEQFGNIRNMKIYRAALWILGEYSETDESIQVVITLVRQSLGQLPIVEDEEARAAAAEEGDDKAAGGDTEMKAKVKQLVTADGTYATQSALLPSGGGFGSGSSKKNAQDPYADRPALRRFLLNGDFFVAATLGSILVKLCTRYVQLKGVDSTSSHALCAEAMYMMACVMHLGKSSLPKTRITEDDLDRLCVCVKLLADRCPQAVDVYIKHCRQALQRMLEAKGDAGAAAILGTAQNVDANGKEKKKVQPDELISFTQLTARSDVPVDTSQNLFDVSLSAALGTHKQASKWDASNNKLSTVTQLAGFSDPVYAEAYINVNQYDIVLDVLIVNQTSDTLEAVSLELATLGDLKLVEKPAPVTLAPHDFTNIRANAKVSSTENSVIFGTITYDVRGSTSDRNAVYLNDMHIDIMDYIVPAQCTDHEFRQMWADFEWENKVTVNTQLTDLRAFLEHIVAMTNMCCLTPEEALTGECGLLAANLYAHSVFGEDALANLSIEKLEPDNPNCVVTGHIRIRAKSQGMALSLGDKINAAQKQATNKEATQSRGKQHASEATAAEE